MQIEPLTFVFVFIGAFVASVGWNLGTWMFDVSVDELFPDDPEDPHAHP